MLRLLDIRDMLIIARQEIAFQPGLNVLTGETGAGKSILLDSLGFVLGWRGRTDLVRQGADRGEVTAVFELGPDHAARAVLDEAGLEADDELVLRRVAWPDGRRQAYVNDRRAGVELLRELGETLVELHGQHDDRGLLNPRGHRALLDEFAGLDLAPLRAAWTAWAAAGQAVETAESALDAARKEEDFLRHAVAELDKLRPEPGEEAKLDAQRRLMQGAERIRADIARAHQALSAEGAEGLMIDARRWLDGAAAQADGRLDTPLAALERAITELGEAADGVERCLEALDFDPRALEATEERLFAIRALARKHGIAPDDLGNFANDLRTKLAAVDDGAKGIDRLRQAEAAARTAWQALADQARATRSKAAERLDHAMAQELAPLKMERALFQTVLSSAEPGPEGQDQITFTVATNPGAPAGALNKIASGGELSRFLLALKVCLTRGNAGLTLIFDEIDRGVGGATADAVGRRLQAIADGAQVLVVTHSPQVAARGAHHWRVEKRVEGDMTRSAVVGLGADQRIEEIARMLAGDRITEAARQAAQALIEG
ncbi:DNA repair protein RecN [Neogemmobacter tilapiae]|uniref:DNA repair protein RecN n=1 Tax=Neogemmobacter tilapiae TaxID=875041 RepID=A0A918WLK7_9RHOB|nr:DNA repair protein RecN [Gemmobacter tilapiae]GHC57322.1 DNA repair protein RecN [Gemmobacter tilapiae]